MKSFLILIVTLITAIGLVVFGLNLKALNTKHQRHHHPLAQLKSVNVFYQGASAQAPANTWEAIDIAIKESPNHLIWLDIHQSKDNTFVLYGSNYVEEYTDGKGHIWNQSDQQLFALDAGYKFKDKNGEHNFRGKGVRIQKLEDTLNRYPLTNFILNIISNKDGTDQKLSALIKEYDVVDRVVVASPFDVILRSLRSKNPGLMYGTGQGELTRLIMFNSLGLAALVPLKGDILLTANKNIARGFDDGLIKEINRRQKQIVSGPITNDGEYTKASTLPFHGLLTNAAFKIKKP